MQCAPTIDVAKLYKINVNMKKETRKWVLAGSVLKLVNKTWLEMLLKN